MEDVRALLRLAADLAADFRESLPTRPVPASATADELRTALGSPLPEGPTDAATVVRELAAASERGLFATPAAASSAS